MVTTIFLGIVLLTLLNSYDYNNEVFFAAFLLLYIFLMPYTICLTYFLFLLISGFDTAYGHDVKPQTLMFEISVSIYIFLTLRVSIARLRAVGRKSGYLFIPFYMVYAAIKKDDYAVSDKKST